jgi:hypothetical protein
MNIRELLSHPAVQLPITRGTDDFQAFVERILDTYVDLLWQVTDSTGMEKEVIANRSVVRSFCESAKAIIRETFAGHPYDAFQHFLQGVEPLFPFIERQLVSGVTMRDLRVLYRVRVTDKARLTREDLFHIPFEDRHKVSTQRYSIPGLPCLYLCGSLYTCWAEMNRPAFHKLHAAAFWLRPGESVRIVNFSDRPAKLKLFFEDGQNSPADAGMKEPIVTHVILWPLIALCSIIVRHRDAPYKPEYILPQIVLQWITKKEDLDGIVYFSTHVEGVTKDHIWPPCNIVLPGREIKPQGRCSKLRRLFKMTTAHPWELLRAVNVGEGSPGGAMPMFDFEFIDGYQERYGDTEFGNVQYKLNKLVIKTWHRNANGEPDLGDVAE